MWMLCVWVVFPHFTVVLPSQSAAVTITWNMDPAMAATKTNWYIGRIRHCYIYFGVEIRASIFNVPLAALQVDESGFSALIKVRCVLTVVASTLILTPVSSTGDDLWRTVHLSKETQESAWSRRLEDRNLNSLLLHHFWTTEDSTTMDQWHSFSCKRFSSLSPSSSAFPPKLFETITGNIWQLIGLRTSTAIFRTSTLHSVTEVAFLTLATTKVFCSSRTLFLHYKYGTIFAVFC